MTWSAFWEALPLYLALLGFIGMVATLQQGATGKITRRTEDGLNGLFALSTAVFLALYPFWLARAVAVLLAIIGAVGCHHWLTRADGPAVIPGTRWLVRLLAKVGIRQK